MQITTILAFFTAMGGLEAVKWLVRYIVKLRIRMVVRVVIVKHRIRLRDS